MGEHADALLDHLTEAKSWPPDDVESDWEQVSRWAAFRDADTEALTPRDWGRDAQGSREYRVTPLPKRIAGAKADMVFGEDPIFTAAAKSDQDSLLGLIRANRLPSQLQKAERICAPEGEVWWRAYVDEEINFPLVQWLSRLSVIPLFRGPLLLAAAFVSEYRGENRKVFRHIEIQERGRAENHLFEGTTEKLGDSTGLDALDATRELDEEWEHELDQLLCGRVLNDEGEDFELGISDFSGVEDIFLALNEVLTVGGENMTLAGKKRIVVPERFLNSAGRFPAGAEIILATETDRDPDKPGQGVATIELTFEAGELIAWKNSLIDEALQGTRTAPQLLGRNTEGAQTGPALRARLIDSVLDAHGKGRYWDTELPECLRCLQRLDHLPEEQGGLGNRWTRADEPPVIERQSILPEDETEKVTRLATEVGALLLSRKTAITEAHPDWGSDRVDEELAQINEENPLPEIGGS